MTPRNEEVLELEATADARLHTRFDRLQRYELDFQHRLAVRLRALGDPSDPHSDVAYRRMAYTLDRLKAHRAKVQDELMRRPARAGEQLET